jgi:hypothetical protein
VLERALGIVKYNAFSYVWGKEVTRQHIKCNGRLMPIGSSLLDAQVDRLLVLGMALHASATAGGTNVVLITVGSRLTVVVSSGRVPTRPRDYVE